MAEVDYIGHALPARGVVLLVHFPVPTKTYFYWINKITRLSSVNEYLSGADLGGGCRGAYAPPPLR